MRRQSSLYEKRLFKIETFLRSHRRNLFFNKKSRKTENYLFPGGEYIDAFTIFPYHQYLYNYEVTSPIYWNIQRQNKMALWIIPFLFFFSLCFCSFLSLLFLTNLFTIQPPTKIRLLITCFLNSWFSFDRSRRKWTICINVNEFVKSDIHHVSTKPAKCTWKMHTAWINCWAQWWRDGISWHE